MAQYIPVPAPPVPGPLLPALMNPVPVPVHAPDLPVPLPPALMDVVPVLCLPPPPMLPVAFPASVPLAPVIPLPAPAIAPQPPLPLARQPFNPNWPVHYMGKNKKWMSHVLIVKLYIGTVRNCPNLLRQIQNLACAASVEKSNFPNLTIHHLSSLTCSQVRIHHQSNSEIVSEAIIMH